MFECLYLCEKPPSIPRKTATLIHVQFKQINKLTKSRCVERIPQLKIVKNLSMILQQRAITMHRPSMHSTSQ